MGIWSSWQHWSGWRQFSAAALFLGALTALLCWISIPEFDRIEPYRLNESPEGQIVVRPNDAGAGDLMIYLPSYGGQVDVTLIGGPETGTDGTAPVAPERPVGSVSAVPGAQLTRDRQFGVMLIPSALVEDGQSQLRIARRADLKDIGITPAYLGPRAAIEPVVAQQRRSGRIMQLLLPVAALVIIAVSTLLIFFSRRPAKYVFLIAAFICQFAVEIADEPVGALLGIDAVMPYLSLATNSLVALAIAAWTESGAGRRQALLASSAALAVVLLVMDLTNWTDRALPLAFATLAFALWIAFVQVLDWVMILTAPRLKGPIRSAACASFLLCGTGLLAYHALAVLRPGIEAAYFLSNWSNVAAGLGVVLFALGALVNEMLAYAAQRRRNTALEQLVAGHHAEIDEQALQLKAEIERRAVLEERQRYLQDMHDGLGGQLLTLLLQLRKSGGAAAPLANDVSAIIGDLRLMTSLFDEQGTTLATMLDHLNGRIERLCSAAGMALDWRLDVPGNIDLRPATVVHLQRMVEEAATNAVRHSGARRLRITIRVDNRLTIEVADDGCGFREEAVTPGSGLRGIRQRAAKLGGRADLASSELDEGTTVRIVLPFDRISQTGPAIPTIELRESPHSSI